MSLHKLTAGDGYTYLTRQVAAYDATSRGYDNLGAYYTEKGEAPGVRLGRGLAGVPDFPVGVQVTEAQMVALFGQGRHPNAPQIERSLVAAGATAAEADRGSRLGAPYKIYQHANDFNRRCAGALRDFNTARGRPGDTAVPEAERARLRTRLARIMFEEEVGRGPVDARELSGFLARASRQATTAVAGYDLTFSPVKSVSLLWALAPRDVAAVIEQAHADAVVDTLTWLEDHAAYTRRGRNGVAQVEVRGLVAAAFTHRDSRAGDPDLHTHVAVSNKVQALDGSWLAVDGRALYTNNVPASERYNTRIEALLTERLGVVFADRTGGEPGKRPVREVVGVDGALPRAWSSRRAAIETRRAVLSAAFQSDHGRPPSAKESVVLAQQANLETRDAKHKPRSFAQQRAAWWAEAVAVLGGEDAVRRFAAAALHPDQASRMHDEPTPLWVECTAADVLPAVSAARATWQENHVRAEAERRARAAGIRAGEVDRAVAAVVDMALSPALSLLLGSQPAAEVPAALRRSDGSSVYSVAGSAMFTSTGIVRAERELVEAAARRGGRVVPQAVVEASLQESAAGGLQLNPGQGQLVRELATSGARVQLALAPAGTGKTAALRALAHAWRAGGGTVVGLAPSAAAAAVLREEIGTDTDTLAKLVHATTTGSALPGCIGTIGPDTLLVVDEAGMAGTVDLAHAVDYVTSRGGSVRLVGDDQQLAAVGAGGVLRDIARSHGAVTLSQVLRFTDPDTGAPRHGEGAASLALRAGDPAALAYYTDHGRVHVGDLSTVVDDAYRAWAAEHAAGRDPVMLAPTRDLVAELNTRDRADRLGRLGADPGPQVPLSDGSAASAGDTVITRRNNRAIPLGSTDWVKNGDRWTVDGVLEHGALGVRNLRTGRRVVLPAEYVAEHVALGYACTVHGAQGLTADTAHTVATGLESRQQLYVAMTRGRHTNHVYLAVAGDGDPHTVITRDSLLPPTAVDILTRVLGRDGASVSATTRSEQLTDPTLLLAGAADRYWHSLNSAAQEVLGDRGLAAIDAAAAAHPELTGSPAYPTLRAHLALRAMQGDDPGEVLAAALADDRGLNDALDAAAVLDWRLDPGGSRSAAGRPLPWLPGVPPALGANHEWGAHLAASADQVRAFAAAVAATARAWAPSTAPAWAVPLIDRDPALVADLAVWRAAQQAPDTHPCPTGPTGPSAAAARAQQELTRRVDNVLRSCQPGMRHWDQLADHLDLRLTGDPYWPVLTDRLTAAHRAGIDIPILLRSAAAAGPLPDEQPAAALWWRLHEHLSPAALDATATTPSGSLRPDWEPALIDLLGPDCADRVQADPAWPGLVAAVADAARAGWTAQQVLQTAHDSLHAVQPEDAPLRPGELATALTWRVALLSDPAPPASSTRASGPSAAATNAAASDGDDWLSGLTEPAPDGYEPPPDVDDPVAENPEGGNLEIDRSLAAAVVAAMREALGPAADEDPYPSDAEVEAMIEDAYRWDTAAVARDRILELNAYAALFFGRCYHGSWAPGYLTSRLGADPSTDGRFAIGYAPASWTALTRHLRRRGATDEELLGAGLARRASSGRLIDRFRDRVVFAITDGDEIHGFIGRRNPTTEDAEHAGPKYLNTPETDLFIKGREMYGLSEAARDLKAGATPVLVEGPLDAIAVTLAGGGDHIGVAPLGTALTDTQADTLTACPGANRRGVLVATDADPAGRRAAHYAYWALTARGNDPRHVHLPDGIDPADLARTRGFDALHDALQAAGPLSETLIRDATQDGRHDQAGVLGRVADVISALPEPARGRHLSDLTAQSDGEVEPALSALSRAADQWADDRAGEVARRARWRRRQPPSRRRLHRRRR